MWTRIWRWLTTPSPFVQAICPHCRDLEVDRNYWRSREERATDALLRREGVAGTAGPLPAHNTNPLGAALAALGKDAYDPRKKSGPS